MSLSITTNIASLNAQRNLAQSQSALSNSINRLSSGLRISSARDELASQSISEAMKSKMPQMTSANNAVSVAQTAEGALSETSNILSRMRELTMQSVNETMTADNRDVLNEEFLRLKDAAVGIANNTSFNGANLLKVDSGASTTITVGTAQFDQRQVALIDNGNPDDGILTRSYDGGVSFTSAAFNISGASSAEQRLNVLKTLDAMQSDVSTARFAVGAFQNKVVSSVSPSSSYDDPGVYTPTSPRVFDYDFASETANLTRAAILQQAGAAVLSQANSLPHIALSLLRG